MPFVSGRLDRIRAGERTNSGRGRLRGHVDPVPGTSVAHYNDERRSSLQCRSPDERLINQRAAGDLGANCGWRNQLLLQARQTVTPRGDKFLLTVEAGELSQA